MTAQGRIQPLDGGRARSMPACGRGRHGGSVAGSQCHPAISWQRGVSSKMRLVLALLLLSLTACVPLFYKYHYISLEDNPNLRVVEHGKPSMYSGTRTFLFDDINIPVRYELVRDAYTVYFEIDAREAYIRAKDHAGTPLSIQSPDYSHIDPMKRCHLFRKPLPDARMPADEKVKGYAWFFHREHCTNSDNSILTFQVLDEDGIMVGEEALSMKKKQGGITWHWDAF